MTPAPPPARLLRDSPATWSVALVIGLLYGLQVLWGGPGSEPLLARMGALHGPSVLDGQLWRLAAGAFLHLDPAHLATNLVVLVAVGRPVEALLGTARWLILFGGALLGGTVASLIFTPGLAVGASGGLLGLLAGCAVLAITRGEALPARLRLLVRSATLLALAVTVVQSLQPGIDMAAHVGGALAGVLIMLVPAMRPEGLATPATEEQRIGAWFVGAVLVLAPTLAVFAGGGWAVMAPPELAPRTWSGVRLPMPDMAPRGTADVSGNRRAQLFGGIEDTAVVGLAVDDLGHAAEAAIRSTARRWETTAPAEGFEPGGVVLEDGRALGQFTGPAGRRLEVALVAVGDRLLRIEVASRRAHAAQWVGVAEKMAAGAAPAEAR